MRHAAGRRNPSLRPAQWGAGFGSAVNLRPEPVALVRFTLSPCWPDGRGGRHRPNARLGRNQRRRDEI
jgi:hypothetical protein